MKDFKTILQDLVDYVIPLDKEAKEPVVKANVNTNIWKSSDGTWQFVGIFSNNYLDKDKKLNILSAESHKKFEKALDDGLVPMPYLRWWHVESNLGVAKQVAFDERGFMIVQGEFYKEYSPLAEALSEWDRTLGMSHRMLPQYITTDPNDDNVITSYVAEEVSFLPVEKAANPLTYFGVQETDTMLEISEKKISPLREALGDERMDQLDLMTARLKEAAEEADLPSKEEDAEEAAEEAQDEPVVDEVEPVVDEEADKEADDVEPAEEADEADEEPEAEVKEEDPSVEAEADEEDEEAPEDKEADEEPVGEAPEADEEPGDEGEETVYVTREQLAEVIDYVKEAFDGVADAVAEIRDAAKVAKEAAEEGRKEAVEKAQDEILMTSLASMLGAAQSVVGSKAAVVKEEDELGKPEEAPVQDRPFIDNAIFSILEG